MKNNLTWSLVRRSVSVVLLPPGFAAFQNCFCAEYRFIGHSLKRQSGERRQEKRKVKSKTSSPCGICFVNDVQLPQFILKICNSKDHSDKFWEISPLVTLATRKQTP